MRSFASVALVAAGLASTAFGALRNPVDPLVIKGSKFFYKTNGTQFYMRGVAYQQEYSTNSSSSETGDATAEGYRDPLADAASCRRDVPLLAELRTNVIRVYAIDPAQNHDECMQLLNNAGIYVVADLSQPAESINRNSPTWNDNLYARYTSVIDNMAQYSNVMGFFAGNEVSNAPNNTQASAFVKAAVRDMKSYIKEKNYRTIGVGYATNDDADIRENMANYFNCGDDQSQAIDFWGYNIYSWCGDSSFQKSGFDVRTEEFSSYSVPVFFAEYGCNTPSPRGFSEVEALYGPQMNDVWSGGIVYMYFQEANNYGLVSVSGNTASKLPDFSSLSSRMADATPTGVNANSYNPTNTPAACPTVGSEWAAPASPLPPTPNQGLCSCMLQTLECVASSSIADEDFGSLFGQVCGYAGEPCAGINTNSSNGAYGAYGMCNATEQLSFAFNQYYQSQRKNANACNFNGAASTKSAAGAASSCSAGLAQAGTAGTGTVTSRPTSGSGSSSSSSSGAASPLGLHHVSVNGALSIGVYVVFAVVTGAAMIAL
ncbi:1,3-beta-glucanosyltransferase [Sphaceloma murrayae]|uniref:1,3-beta-glucanosyltransferase n=1 Tax=Sphaceloma murrayae TaxID=2082308 RepID=A0A2K1R201_9PEZI|nr:1,3-beta-glucanosyltransferase [Sphaceloma murrayae]